MKKCRNDQHPPRVVREDRQRAERGEWVYCGYLNEHTVCSVCGYEPLETRIECKDENGEWVSRNMITNLSNYCPNCGADMRGEKDV